MARGEAEHFWTFERLAKLRELAGQRLHDGKIAPHFGLSRDAIGEARRKHGIPGGYSHPGLMEPPPGFDLIAHTMTIPECARHFGVSESTGRRWYAKTGITAKPRTYPRREPKPLTRKVVHPFRISGRTPIAPPPLRDYTVAARAQLHLQHLFPVFRAIVRDPSAPMDIWVVNGRRITESEMIQRAERHGFRAEAMAA